MTTVGFTGTQVGMTDGQMGEFKKAIRRILPTQFHVGDCIGADAEAYDIVWTMMTEGELDCRIIVHPPEDEKKRAFKGFTSGGIEVFVEVRESKPYLERNHDIVDETNILIAAPRSLSERLRSGTWSTVRYARRQYHPIQMLEP